MFKEIACAIGESTNNVAEYSALICGLQEALVAKIPELHIFTDSELLYKQLKGEYQVKDERMKFLHGQVKTLVKGFKRVNIQHVPREENKDADRLASSVLKPKRAAAVASLFDDSGEESPNSAG